MAGRYGVQSARGVLAKTEEQSSFPLTGDGRVHG